MSRPMIFLIGPFVFSPVWLFGVISAPLCPMSPKTLNSCHWELRPRGLYGAWLRSPRYTFWWRMTKCSSCPHVSEVRVKLQSEPHTCCRGICKWMASYRWTLDGLHQGSTMNRCSLRLPWTPWAEVISIRNLELLGNRVDLILQETRNREWQLCTAWRPRRCTAALLVRCL